MSLNLSCSKCSHESVSFDSLNKLEEHVVLMHVPLAGLIYKCTFCQPIIHCLTESNYFQHCTKMHPNEGKLKVQFLTSAPKSRAEVKELIDKCLGYSLLAKHLEPKPSEQSVLLELQCFDCSMIFSTINKLEEHLVLEHSCQTYKCAGCPAMSSYPTEASILNNLAQHQHNQSSEIELIFSPGARVKRQQIETFLQKSLLITHASAVKIEAPFRRLTLTSVLSNTPSRVTSEFTARDQFPTPSTYSANDQHLSVEPQLTFDKLDMPTESANYEQDLSLTDFSSSNLVQDSCPSSESNGLLKTITHPAVEVHENTLNYVETMNTVFNTSQNSYRNCAHNTSKRTKDDLKTKRNVGTKRGDSAEQTNAVPRGGALWSFIGTYPSLRKFDKIRKQKFFVNLSGSHEGCKKEGDIYYYRCSLAKTENCNFKMKAVVGRKGDRSCTVFRRRSAKHNH